MVDGTGLCQLETSEEESFPASMQYYTNAELSTHRLYNEQFHNSLSILSAGMKIVRTRALPTP